MGPRPLVQLVPVVLVLSLLAVACGDDGGGGTTTDAADQDAVSDAADAGDADAGDAVEAGDADAGGGDAEVGGDVAADALPDLPPGEGRVFGVVSAFNGVGFDVVEGARISGSGRTAVSDARGRFILDEVATSAQAVALTVEGPAAELGGQRYEPLVTRVAVTVDEPVAVVVATLLPRCVQYVDAAAGGSVAFDSCGGVGPVELVVPAGAVLNEDGNVFAGLVEVRLAAVDPGAPLSFAGLPRDASLDGASTVLGAAAVSLVDAAGIEALEIAPGSGTEIAFAIDDPAGASTLDVERWDDETATWEAGGTGTIENPEAEGALRLQLDQTGRYRALGRALPESSACVTLDAEVCIGANCEAADGSVMADFVLDGQVLQVEASRGCVSVPEDVSATLAVHYIDNPVTFRAEPLYRIPIDDFEIPNRDAVAACPGDCIERRVEITPLEVGCVAGQLQVPCVGPDPRQLCRAPATLSGDLRFELQGDVVAGSTCTGDEGHFCAAVPVGLGRDGALDLVHPSGFATTVEDPANAGMTCTPSCLGGTATDPDDIVASACLDIGTIPMPCGAAGGCLTAAFYVQVELESPGPSPCAATSDTELAFVLDPAPATGPANLYDWEVLDDRGRSLPCGELDRCRIVVADGEPVRLPVEDDVWLDVAETYQIRLTLRSQADDGRPLSATAFETIDVCDDCDGNGSADLGQIVGNPDNDCDASGVLDACELDLGLHTDCTRNDVSDICDIRAGDEQDCNGNRFPDSCETFANPDVDCDGNRVPDSCELEDDPSLDCNGNGQLDSCDLASGGSTDANDNGIPDDCETPCTSPLHDGGDGVCIAEGECADGYTLETATGRCARWVASTGETPEVLGQPIVLDDGNVLLVSAGPLAETREGRVWTLDPGLNEWSVKSEMAAPRSHAGAVLLADGRVLVAGGYTSSDETSDLATVAAELYDPESDDPWSAAGEMLLARAEHALVRLDDGTVLAIGGFAASDTPLDNAELYDPVGDDWAVAIGVGDGLAALPFASPSFAALLDDGRVFAIGLGDAGLAAVLYDPSDGQWRATSAPSFEPAGYAAVGDTVVATAGVLGGGDDTLVTTTSVYDASTEEWGEVASRPSTAVATLAATLSSGEVLTLGSPPDDGLEVLIYDPVGDAWYASVSTTNRMLIPVELQDGRVLAVGATEAAPEIWERGE